MAAVFSKNCRSVLRVGLDRFFLQKNVENCGKQQNSLSLYVIQTKLKNLGRSVSFLEILLWEQSKDLRIFSNEEKTPKAVCEK